MKSHAATFVGTLLLLSAANVSAEPIPIDEEFVVAQQLHVDSSWDAIVIQLLGDGLVDSGATLQYQGTYQIFEESPGVFSGSYSGLFSGTYLGQEWALDYASAMSTDVLQNKIWDLESKGKWKRGPYEGKDFIDKGKLTEKTNSKADLEIEIQTEGVTQKIKTTATDLKKEKAGGKLKVSGDIEITDDKGKKHKEKLTLELDQANKTFTSKLTSTFAGIVVLENTGTFTAVNDGPNVTGDTSFDITVSHVPEPATLLLLGAGFGGLIFPRRNKPAAGPAAIARAAT